ncbi:hypothetical protein [Corynebacterium lujinxingii]|uniref:Uncharacterized protein n=1 Tax=Corynebacterium lujinxingii TaxID=2763010 RepID=A0A7H0JWQ2_9CORY|nr:hypothetical protein [Corynebacterium lujinxingii]MBC3178118.1 hypothetical protein [Corynebacterium lujinxingii]NNO09642.1 hypothetical protein [Corynebacterium lujinxingii]QNP89468.1 hypothetical protein IAU68_07080 [Corynebacterium lujinxingii]
MTGVEIMAFIVTPFLVVVLFAAVLFLLTRLIEIEDHLRAVNIRLKHLHLAVEVVAAAPKTSTTPPAAFWEAVERKGVRRDN